MFIKIRNHLRNNSRRFDVCKNKKSLKETYDSACGCLYKGHNQTEIELINATFTISYKANCTKNSMRPS